MSDIITDPQTLLFIHACRAVGMRNIRLEDYPNTVEGYHGYMDAILRRGYSFFSPTEMLGKYATLPPQIYWPRLALSRFWADNLRGDHPARVRWSWRPESVNARYGGAPDSAHLDCCALDLYFDDPQDHGEAVEECRRLYNSQINFGCGIGIGATMIHFDFFSMFYLLHGRARHWTYPSFRGRLDYWRNWRKERVK